jgi:hypothetical protein
MLLLIIVLVLLFGWGGYSRYGNYNGANYGPHIGIGTILLILLVLWLFLGGGLSHFGYR